MVHIGTKKLDRQCLDDIPGLAAGYGSASANPSQSGHKGSTITASRDINILATGDGTTDITAGNTLNLTSGRDTTLHGAQAKGKTINAHIGRNLTLTSTQDSNHYTEKDQSGGAGLSLCVPPICYGTSSGSASYSQNDIRNNYQSVTDQTGLAAGKGGFDIHVGHTTTLTGAAIASQATPDKNQLDTGNLKLNSLRNIAISSANQVGGSFNTSGSLGSNLTQNAKGATLNFAIPQNGYQVSETESRIAKGTIRVRNHPNQDLSGINRNATTLDGNGVANDFDLDQIKENQELGQATGYVGMRVAGDIAQYQQRQAVNDLIKAKGKNDPKAEAEAQAKLANWGDGGKYATALHGMIGAATAAIGGGNAAQGAMGAAASEAASGIMQDYLDKHDIKPDSTTGNTLMNLASAAIGATTGQGAGAATALYGDKYNRQLHKDESSILAVFKQGKTPQEQHRLNAAACALTRCARGVPDSDPNKAKLLALQQEGSQYRAEQETLVQTGLFQYDGLDPTNDFLLRHDKAVTKTEALGQTIGGALGTAGSYTLVTSGCATGLGCLIAAPAGAVIAGTSAMAYKHGYDKLTQSYQSQIGQQVIDSFNPETYPGEGHPTLNLAASVGTDVVLARFGASSLKGVKHANDWVGDAAMLGQSTKQGGLNIVGDVSKQVLGTRIGDGLIAGGGDVAVQLIQNGGQTDQINWIDVGTTTTAGALGHGRGLGTSIAIGAGAGVANTEVNNLVHGTDQSLLLGGAEGILSSGIGYGASGWGSGALEKIGASPAVSQISGGIAGATVSDAGSTLLENIGNNIRKK